MNITAKPKAKQQNKKVAFARLEFLWNFIILKEINFSLEFGFVKNICMSNSTNNAYKGRN